MTIPVAAFLIPSLFLLAGAGCSVDGREETAGPEGSAAVVDSIPGWPRDVRQVMIPRSGGGDQPALFHAPPAAEGPSPLLVALHTWSGDYTQDTGAEYLAEARERGWVFIHPRFRGPNVRPGAGGSPEATRDILDAVDWARAHADVDSTRIYLTGHSGGGHMSLLTAARSPEVWAAVSAWVPITGLARWHAECAERGLKYAGDLENICGGAPGASGEVDNCYRLRSPETILAALAGVPVEISAGIRDGHDGSVPVGHTLRGFNLLARANGHPGKILTGEQIGCFEQEAAVPAGLTGEREEDPSYAEHEVLFRRQAGPARVTIFDGGHEGIPAAAAEWLSGKSRKN